MKKILIILGVAVVVMTAGIAIANEMAMKADVPHNGITVFEAITIYDSGPLALSSRAHEPGPGLALDNDVTLFAAGPVSTDVNYKTAPVTSKAAEGMAAGGLQEERPGMELHNGITIFNNAAVEAN